MAAVWISIVFLSLIGSALSGLDPSICSIFEKSYGLIPPPLPTNFEIKTEHVDHNRNVATYQELYFDYTNSRAKYKYLLDSMEYNYLFDYDTHQVVEWIKVNPGTSIKNDPLSQYCEAKDMVESPVSPIFGYQDWTSEHPKMFNSFQVLRYGGQYQYAANGSLKLDDKGMKVNKFVGCLFDDALNATLFNDYYFADTDSVLPSGGTPYSVVTGYDNTPLSVPVTLHMTGAAFNKNNRTDINETYSISWFKGNPQFEDETFQIPPWVYCEDYIGRKPIPKLPTAFSTRLVTTEFLLDVFGQRLPKDELQVHEEIYYDAEKKLARRDFTPIPDSKITSLFASNTSVRSVYDFNEGIVFFINKQSGRCVIEYIQKDDMFNTEQVDYLKLKTPENLFLMAMDDMQYKGKATARDIKCDVWNGRHYNEKLKAKIGKEMYFATEGWHEVAEEMVEYKVPVKNVILMKEKDGEVAQAVTTYNFLKFKNKAPFLSQYDIKNCVELIPHKRFAIALADYGDIFKLIFKYKYLFLDAAQLYLTNKTGVNTPLRVQRLHLLHESFNNDKVVFLVFTLLDKAPIRSDTVYGQKGEELSNAIVLLQRVVDEGKFSITFKDPQTKEVIDVRAQKGSLYYLSESGKLTSKLTKSGKLTSKSSETWQVDETVVTFEEDYEEHEGMTPGHLALLAFAMLFIGIGIGIAVMYLYIRIYSERRVEDRIGLSEASAGSSTRETLEESKLEPQ